MKTIHALLLIGLCLLAAFGCDMAAHEKKALKDAEGMRMPLKHVT